MSLEQAPAHVMLAVDLIELLENNQIDPRVVLAALPIIERDYRAKLRSQPPAPTPNKPDKAP